MTLRFGRMNRKSEFPVHWCPCISDPPDLVEVSKLSWLCGPESITEELPQDGVIRPRRRVRASRVRTQSTHPKRLCKYAAACAPPQTLDGLGTRRCVHLNALTVKPGLRPRSAFMACSPDRKILGRAGTAERGEQYFTDTGDPNQE